MTPEEIAGRLMDPRPDWTCKVCGQKRPAGIIFAYGDEYHEGAPVSRVCLMCLKDAVNA